MRIVFVSFPFWPPDFGGELLLCIERLQSLKSRGHSIRVLTCGQADVPSRETRDGLLVDRSPVVPGRLAQRLLRRPVFYFWVLWQILREQAEVVHFGSGAGIGPITSALALGTLAVLANVRNAGTVHVHSLADREDLGVDFARLRGRLKLWAWSRMSRIVAVSPALLGGLQQPLGHRAVLIRNCARDDLFRPVPPSKHTGTRGASFGTGDVVFAFLGSISQRKGMDLLATAFANLSAENPSWKLLVIGPRNRSESQNLDISEVERVLRPLEGNSNVRYCGRVDSRETLAELLAGVDVFVFPTRKEGMPLAPLEAMCMELPVIIANLPGVTDQMVISGQTGLHFEPGNVSELQAAMESLGRNSQLRRQMGQAARRMVLKHFSWRTHIDEWERLYSRVARANEEP